MTHPNQPDPQPRPRRAFIEPVNGFEFQPPIQHTPQGVDRAGHPYPPVQPYPPQQPYDYGQPQRPPQPIVINNVAAAQANAANIYVGPRTNHLLHLILTLCTFGLWGFVWLILWLSRGCR